MFPKVVVLFTSYRCDSKCLMCSAWIKQRHSPELSLKQIEEIFTDTILKKNIEIINLTGGEPTIRNDIPDIVKILINKCQKLYRIDIPTNGINTEQVIDKIERILAILLPYNIKLNITVSVDGIGKVHERVRGVSNIFSKIDRTIKELKELTTLYPFLSMNINATVSKANINEFMQVRSYAHSVGLSVNFTLAAISEIGVESMPLRDKFDIRNVDKKNVIDFFEKLINEEEITRDYGEFIITWLRTGRRSLPCGFKNGNAFLLEPNGDAYTCGNFKEFRIGNLLKEPFETIWRKNSKRLRNITNKCLNCVSNCYIDEIR